MRAQQLQYFCGLAIIVSLMALNSYFILSKMRWDGANYVFHAIEHGGFYAPQNRYFNYLIQVPHKIVLETTGSIEWALRLYLFSIANWHLVFIAVFGFFYRPFVMWGLFLVAGSAPFLFFYPISEILAACLLSLALFTYLLSEESENKRAAAIIMTMIFLLIVHPISLLTVSGLLGVYYFERIFNSVQRRNLLQVADFRAAVLAIIGFAFVSRMRATGYEKQRMGFDLPSFDKAGEMIDGFMLYSNHFYLLLAFLAVMSFVRKDPKPLLCVFLVVTGFFLLAVSSTVAVFDLAVWQHQLLPIWLFCIATGFCLSQGDAKFVSTNMSAVIAVCFCSTMIVLSSLAALQFGEGQFRRVEEMRLLLQSSATDSSQKLLIPKEHSKHRVMRSNDLPLEALIMSNLSDGVPILLAAEGLEKRLRQFEQRPPTALFADYGEQDWVLLEAK